MWKVGLQTTPTLASMPDTIPNQRQYEMKKMILMDVEGTTTSISFVHDVLFPYSKDNLIKFLEKEFNNKANKEVQEALIEISNLGMMEKLFTGTFNQEIALRVLLQLINSDRKVGALKIIQGFQWKTGYESGALLGHVYPDVPECLHDWKEQGLKLGIYSSGSVQAQKLLFAHTKYGNLAKYFDHHFDTTVGGKKEKLSYENILKEVGLSANEVLFLSDIAEELLAAQSAGMEVMQLIRTGTASDSRFKGIRDFTEVDEEAPELHA